MKENNKELKINRQQESICLIEKMESLRWEVDYRLYLKGHRNSATHQTYIDKRLLEFINQEKKELEKHKKTNKNHYAN